MSAQREGLEFQANRIEAVLSQNGVPAKVTGGTVTPRWVRFQVLPAIGAKVSRIKGLSEELAAALDAPNCQVSRRGAAVAVEVPRDDPQPVRFAGLHQQLMESAVDGHYTNKEGLPRRVTALLGLAEDGAPLLIQLPSKDVGHILAAGAKDAGKTTLLYSIVISLALASNPDEIAFCFLGDIASLVEPIEQLGFQASALPNWSAVVAEAIQAAGKHVIIVADDIAGQATVASKLARVMNHKKLHFVLAWDGIPPERIVNLFKVRLVGRMANTADARTATGWSGTGAEQLMGRGDFLAVAEGRVSRFQAAHVSEQEISEVTREPDTNSLP